MARLTLVLGTALAMCVFAGGAAAFRTATRASTLELRFLTEISVLRTTNGLAPLRLQPGLTRAAEAHSLEMVRIGYFGHDSADGTAFQSRIAGFYPRVRRAGWRAAENLVWRTESPTAPSLIATWLASPAHRANLLRPDVKSSRARHRFQTPRPLSHCAASAVRRQPRSGALASPGPGSSRRSSLAFAGPGRP